MIPMPIFIPFESSSAAECIYPKWVETIMSIGVVMFILGSLWAMAALALSLVTDKVDPLEKPHVYSIVLMVVGFVIITIGGLLMLLTGQKAA